MPNSNVSHQLSKQFYAEMKRAGHVGKVEAVLAGETTTNTAIVAPTTKTPVKNINDLTEEEIAAVKREIMNANPSITDPSMIEVEKKGNGTAGGATVTIMVLKLIFLLEILLLVLRVQKT